MQDTAHARTIAVTYRNRSRFARIRLRCPGRRPPWLYRPATRYPGEVELPDYDAELAMELIGGTGELPTSKPDLIVVLTHYRHALLALATQLMANQTASGQ